MYEYKFVQISLKAGFKGRRPLGNYHQIIEEHAREGWRLVQVFAPAISGYGAAEYYELIFEKLKK